MIRLTSFGIAALTVMLSLPANAASRQQARIDDAIDVIRDFTEIPETAIPDSLLGDAYGIAVIPGVLKVGLGFGGKFGKGLLVVRQDDGSWSNPAFVTLGGGSFGWQIGAQSTDMLLVFKDRRSIDGIVNDKVTFGAEASAAAGPVGRQTSAATDAQMKATIYSYSRSRGLFAGVSLEGAWFAMDRKANSMFYGDGVSPEQILSSRSLMAPAAAGDFLNVLTAVAPPIKMDVPLRRAVATGPQQAPASVTEPVVNPDDSASTYDLEPVELDDLVMGGDETMF